MDCNAAGQMAQKLTDEMLMAQQQQGFLQGQQPQHWDPLLNISSPTGMMMPPTMDASRSQQQAAMMRQQAEMERAFQQLNNPNTTAGQGMNVANNMSGMNVLMQQQQNMATAMAAASLPGMMMSVPRTQFQSTFQTSNAMQASPINLVSNTADVDNSWVNALGNQEYAQTYDNVENFLPPGQESQTVEELTKKSEFYGFMDQIRDRHVLIDEVNGKVVAGPGPEPVDVEGDTEHLKAWAAAEGLNMPASVFEKPTSVGQNTGAGVGVSGLTTGAMGMGNVEEEPMADVEALGTEDLNEWAEEYAKMQERQQESMNTCDYPFEENNPYMYTEDPLKEGRELLQMSNLAEAALAFEAVCKKNNDHKEAWVLLGKTQAENEKDQLAIIALNNARRVDSSDIAVHAALAVSHTNEHNVLPAMECMKAWLANHPRYQQLGQMTIDPDPEQDLKEEYSPVDPTRLREIVTLYTAAQEMNPNDPELFSNLGVIYNISHDYDAAADSFRAAANLRPNDATLWNRLGASLANGGRGEEALEAYRRALDMNPGYVRAMYNLAVSQSNLGRHEKAAKIIISALGIQRGATDPTRRGPQEAQNLWELLRMCLSMMQRQDLVEMTYHENVEEFTNLFQ